MTDVGHALDFLKANAVRFDIDATRIVLLGRSAGGQIALSAAYGLRNPAIRGVVSFYGPTDLVWGYQHPSRRWVLNSTRALCSISMEVLRKNKRPIKPPHPRWPSQAKHRRPF
jgi:hypothetical protein